MLLKEKTALITGASRGIGKAIAELFVANGANVAFTYRSSKEEAKELEKELSKKGVTVHAYKSDASSYADAVELTKQVMEDFGQMTFW